MQIQHQQPCHFNRCERLFSLGRYERPERKALEKFLNYEIPVVEFGAAIGVIACLTNKRLRDPQKHVVVEANPTLLPLLTENRDRNDCRFTIINRAVAYGSDVVDFHQCVNYLGSSVQAESGPSISVPTVTLEEVVDEFGFEYCSLICDIEGGEGDLVQHEADVLRTKVKTLMVEVHEWAIGAGAVKGMFSTLDQIGFVRVSKEGDTHVFQNKMLN